MIDKIVYSDSLLDRLSERDSFKILQRHDKYTNKSRIDFECSCGKVYNKSNKLYSYISIIFLNLIKINYTLISFTYLL